VPAGYPIVVDLAGRPVVVVGAGPVATRKVTGLLGTGAAVRVVAPEALPGLAALAGAGRITLERRPYAAGDLDGAALAFAAGPAEVNRRVAADAARAGIPVAVTDDRGAGTFTTPATLRRGELLIAVATGGLAPGLAGALRRRLGLAFGPEWAELVELLAAARDRLPAAADTEGWDRLLDGPVPAAVRAGDHAGARRLLAELLGARDARPARHGGGPTSSDPKARSESE
jgi:precorrin-2 dehydrogenase / sirohydrochlorin ferrochelatase